MRVDPPICISTVLVLVIAACGGGNDAGTGGNGLATSYPGRAADEAIDYPEEIDIPALSIATDSGGNLWALAGPGPDRWVITRYDPESGGATQFPIYAPRLDGFFTGVIRSDGAHTIAALGHLIADFDANSGEHTLFDVEVDVSAMELSGRRAYLASRDVSELRELDLDSGSVRVLALGDDFFGVEDIAIVDDMVWVTTGFFTDASPAALTGRLNLADGTFTAVPVETLAIEAVDQSRVYALGSSPVSLVQLGADGAQALAQWLTSALEEPLRDLGSRPDLLAIDAKRSILFLTDLARGRIVRVDLSGEHVDSYDLPTEYIDADCSTDEQASCATRAEIGTAIWALAVAPNGDLYFLDGTRYRIGVIHAGR